MANSVLYGQLNISILEENRVKVERLSYIDGEYSFAGHV